MKAPRTAFATPTGTKLQSLLDEGDIAWFARSHERERRRFYFRGEQIDEPGEPGRYVIVTRQPDGTLTRRFEQEGGGA